MSYLEDNLMTIEITGNWKKGYALDIHTIESTYLGENEQGHDQWETIRSEIGDLVYQLKYQMNVSIVPTIIGHINRRIRGLDSMDYIVPVPPSKRRRIQPVALIAKALGQSVNVPVLEHLLSKDRATELKDIDNLEERERTLQSTVKFSGETDISGKKILLLDDLYRSGITLTVLTDVLCKEGRVKDVYVLAMTKTRSNR